MIKKSQNLEAKAYLPHICKVFLEFSLVINLLANFNPHDLENFRVL